jgi:hypothetical protein
VTTRTPRVRGLMVWAAIAFLCAAAGCSGSGSESAAPTAGASAELALDLGGGKHTVLAGETSNPPSATRRGFAPPFTGHASA